jgi:hypothetical protein
MKPTYVDVYLPHLASFAAMLAFGKPPADLFKLFQVRPPTQEGSHLVLHLGIQSGDQIIETIARQPLGVAARDGLLAILLPRGLGDSLAEHWKSEIDAGRIQKQEACLPDGTPALGFWWRPTPGRELFRHTLPLVGEIRVRIPDASG